jgi:hypothetical protein
MVPVRWFFSVCQRLIEYFGIIPDTGVFVFCLYLNITPVLNLKSDRVNCMKIGAEPAML